MFMQIENYRAWQTNTHKMERRAHKINDEGFILARLIGSFATLVSHGALLAFVET